MKTTERQRAVLREPGAASPLVTDLLDDLDELETQRDEALARAKDAMTARAVYDSVVNENAALRAELARKTEALRETQYVLRRAGAAIVSRVNGSDCKFETLLEDIADSLAAEPKAGGPKTSEANVAATAIMSGLEISVGGDCNEPNATPGAPPSPGTFSTAWMIQRAAILPDTPPREPDPCRARYAPGEFGKRHIMCSMFGPDRVKSHGAECQHKDEWHIPVRAYSDEEIEALKAR